MRLTADQTEYLLSLAAELLKEGGELTGAEVQRLAKEEIRAVITDRTGRALLAKARARASGLSESALDVKDPVLVFDRIAFRQLLADLGRRWKTKSEPPPSLTKFQKGEWQLKGFPDADDVDVGMAAFLFFAGKTSRAQALGFANFPSVTDILGSPDASMSSHPFFDAIVRGRPMLRDRWLTFEKFAQEVLGGSQDVDNLVGLRRLRTDWVVESKAARQSILAYLKRIEEMGTNRAKEFKKLFYDPEIFYLVKRVPQRPSTLIVEVISRHKVKNLTLTPLALNPARWYEIDEARQIQYIALTITMGGRTHPIPLHLTIDAAQPSFGFKGCPIALARLPTLLPPSSPAAEEATVCWRWKVELPLMYRDIIVAYLPTQGYRIALLEGSDTDVELRIGDQPSLLESPVREGELKAWEYEGLMLSHHVIGIRLVPVDFEEEVNEAIDDLAERLNQNGVNITQIPAGESWTKG